MSDTSEPVFDPEERFSLDAESGEDVLRKLLGTEPVSMEPVEPLYGPDGEPLVVVEEPEDVEEPEI